jgi:excisionase family DNA binding protein
MSEFMTVAEVADHLRVTDKTIYRLLWSGQVPAAKIGQQWRFERALIDNWVQRNSIGVKANILVIDDEEAIQSLFREILQELGHRVMVTGSGFDGLELVKQWAFDLIFLDLKLPVIDGASLFSEIRKIKPKLPVVIITGYPDSNTMAQALAYGPCTVMKKPFGEKDIIAAVSSFLRVGEVKRVKDSRHRKPAKQTCASGG